MDLTTLRKKLKKGRHNNAAAFQNDVRLIWENCKQYNGEDTEFYKLACKMSRATEKLIVSMDNKEAEAVNLILSERKKSHPNESDEASPPPTSSKRPRDLKEEAQTAKVQPSTPIRTKKPRSQPPPPPPIVKPTEKPTEQATEAKSAEPAPDPDPVEQKLASRSVPPPPGESDELKSAEEIAARFRAKKAADKSEARAIRMSDPERAHLRAHLLGSRAAQLAAANEKRKGVGQRYLRQQ